MQKVIENTGSGDLLTASEANRTGFYSAYGRASGCILRATPNIVWFYTAIPVPLLNGVIFANFRSATAQASTAVVDAIGGIRAKIDEHGIPALWWLGPLAAPDSLGPLLEQNGLEPSGEVPGMAIDLDTLDDQPEAIEGLIIQKVKTPEQQALWAQVAAVGTGFPEAAANAMARIEAGLDDPLYRTQLRYIGLLDGAPVATSAMVLDSGLAGIYAVATLPEARRKGIGGRMTAAPLLEARQMGYRVGILQASSMGYPIYKKLGFKQVCTYKIYLQK